MVDFYDELEKYEKQIQDKIQSNLISHFETLSHVIIDNSFINNNNLNNEIPSSREIINEINTSIPIKRLLSYKIQYDKKNKYTINAIDNSHSRNKINSCFGQCKLNTTLGLDNKEIKGDNDTTTNNNMIINNNSYNNNYDLHYNYNNMFYSTQTETEIIKDIVIKSLYNKLKSNLKKEKLFQFLKPSTENGGSRKVKTFRLVFTNIHNYNNNVTNNNIKHIRLKDNNKQQQQQQGNINKENYWKIANYQIKQQKKLLFNHNHLPSAKLRANIINEQHNQSNNSNNNNNLTPLPKQPEIINDNTYNHVQGIKIKLTNINAKNKIMSNKHKNISPIFKIPKTQKRILSSRMRIKGRDIK
jgi:hypothetical protein